MLRIYVSHILKYKYLFQFLMYLYYLHFPWYKLFKYLSIKYGFISKRVLYCSYWLSFDFNNICYFICLPTKLMDYTVLIEFYFDGIKIIESLKIYNIHFRRQLQWIIKLSTKIQKPSLARLLNIQKVYSNSNRAPIQK